jgi:predicted  nucleic acid-binding Zn-ribbon protein
MEPQHVIDIVLGLGLSVLGWFARELWTAVKELKNDLSKLREDLPKTYVARDDYRQDMSDIKSMLGKIFDKLDDKQDK